MQSGRFAGGAQVGWAFISPRTIELSTGGLQVASVRLRYGPVSHLIDLLEA